MLRHASSRGFRRPSFASIADSWSPGAGAFNRTDAEAPTASYHRQAVNHQAAEEPVAGAAAIREMFARGLTPAEMVGIVEHVFEDGGPSMAGGSAAAASWPSPTTGMPSSAAAGAS